MSMMRYLLLLLTVVGVLSALSCAGQSAATTKSGWARTIETSELILRDSDGNVRAVIGTSPTQFSALPGGMSLDAGIEIRDKDGHPRLVLSMVQIDGEPGSGVIILGPDRQIIGSLCAADKGGAIIQIGSEVSGSMLRGQTTPEGGVEAVLKAQPRSESGRNGNEDSTFPRLVLAGPGGHSITLGMIGDMHQRRIGLSVNGMEHAENGVIELSLSDEDGGRLGVISRDGLAGSLVFRSEDGRTVLRVLDNKGNISASLPAEKDKR